jgi:hypothetical protein
MRYLFGLLCVCALVALPLSASAQDAEEDATSEPNLQEPAPSAEPAPEEPALQLELTPAGVDVVPSPPRTFDGYTLEELELRVKRARIGLGVSGGAFVVGFGMAFGALGAAFNCSFVWAAVPCSTPGWVAPVGWTGMALVVGGFGGMIASGILKRRRKRDRDSLRYAHFGTPHRVQWDLARSRLVF